MFYMAEHRRRRQEGTCSLPTPFEINSGRFEIIRALNFGEDSFFRDHINSMWKKGKFLVHLETFWFVNSGRYFKHPPSCFALLRLCGQSFNGSRSVNVGVKHLFFVYNKISNTFSYLIIFAMIKRTVELFL